MKRQIAKEEITFIDRDVEVLIQHFHHEVQLMSIKGKQDASASKLISYEYWQARVHGFLEAKAKNTITAIQQKMQPVASAMKKNAIGVETNHELNKLFGDIRDLEVESTKQDLAIRDIKIDFSKVILDRAVLAIVCIAGVSDGYLAWNSLYSGGLSLFQSLIYGIVLAVMIGAGAHFAADWIRLAKTISKARIRFTIIAFSALALFLLVGLSRAQYLNADTIPVIDTDSQIAPDDNSILGYVIGGISWFIFMAGLLFSALVWRSPAEKAAYVKYKSQKKELKALQQTIQDKEAQSITIRQTMNEENHLINQKCEYALSAKKRVLSMAHEGLSLYANAYLTHSHHNDCPPFFSQYPQFNI